MKFNELLTYLMMRGVVDEPHLVDVCPLGVQYRLTVKHNQIKGSIYYREINGDRIMVKNVLLGFGKNFIKGIDRDLSLAELLDVLT